jgi:hypothetical protein
LTSNVSTVATPTSWSTMSAASTRAAAELAIG